MLAQWSPADGAYRQWAFRGLKGDSADWALHQGLVGRPPPNGAVRHGGRLELFDSRELLASPEAGDVDAVTFCLGVKAAPLPIMTAAAADGGVELVEPAGHRRGGLYDRRGRRIPGVFGVGMAFTDTEFSSGAAYPEAGFMPFAQRAAEVAAEVARL